MKMFKQQKLWIFTDQWTYKYVQQNKAHAIECITRSENLYRNIVVFFFCVYPLVRLENSKPKPKPKLKQNAMAKNFRKFSTQWYTSYRYTLEQIGDIHSPNHKLPIWINQADLPIPSIHLYSFLWNLFFFFPSFKCVRSDWVNVLHNVPGLVCAELNFWWNFLA